MKDARTWNARPAARRTIPAGKFKPECLRLMDLVNETGEEIVITKRNRPVAMLVPVPDAELRPFVGRSSGVIHASREDLMAPVDEDWEVDADL
ncbi:MAG TPA: type II toxin-antitoxin system Phd/YefM family antitoxin [Longimicrobiaceae bacterium]|nr:type II toxin-antitoxin system Phd/YefM family antitoxin [Longimicrobiaceae bacterium]